MQQEEPNFTHWYTYNLPVQSRIKYEKNGIVQKYSGERSKRSAMTKNNNLVVQK